jgi:hypothetical protein
MGQKRLLRNDFWFYPRKFTCHPRANSFPEPSEKLNREQLINHQACLVSRAKKKHSGEIDENLIQNVFGLRRLDIDQDNLHVVQYIVGAEETERTIVWQLMKEKAKKKNESKQENLEQDWKCVWPWTWFHKTCLYTRSLASASYQLHWGSHQNENEAQKKSSKNVLRHNSECVIGSINLLR